MTYCLRLPTLKLRCAAADMLAALCVMSGHGHQLVLDGLSDSRVTFGETYRFERLVSSLGAYDDDPIDRDEADNAIWEWRASVLGLLNALVGQADDVESRCGLRGELRRRGLDHALHTLEEQEPTQSLLVQAAIYRDEGLEDASELRQLDLEYLRSQIANGEEVDSGEIVNSEPGAEHEVHLGGLYEEISDLRDQVSQSCSHVANLIAGGL